MLDSIWMLIAVVLAVVESSLSRFMCVFYVGFHVSSWNMSPNVPFVKPQILVSLIHFGIALVYGQFLLVKKNFLHNSNYQLQSCNGRWFYLYFSKSTSPLVICLFLSRWILVIFAAWAYVSIKDCCNFWFCIRKAMFSINC